MKERIAQAKSYRGTTLTKALCGITVSLAIPLFCVSTTHHAHAARENAKNGPLVVRVHLETKPEPTNAVGILLSTDGAKQITETRIQKLSDRLYEVSFEVDRKQLQDDSVATAMAVSAMGDISFANVTPVTSESGGDFLGSIPDCAPEDPTQIATLEQTGLVQQLVGVKKQRAALAKKKVALALDEETAKKIQNFETALGLSNVEPISAELPPAELVDRLSRLNFAIKRYKAFKPRSTSNSNKNAQ